jgi:2-C-methyl-D-erythritol 4-phosphate cytidylyltransferase
MLVVALVLGAGAGLRLGIGQPKGHVRVHGRTLLEWSSAALEAAPSVDGVLPVVPSGPAHEAPEPRLSPGSKKRLAPVQGGPTRQASLANGLAALGEVAPRCEWVIVHDAARCLVRPEDAESVLRIARSTGAAISAIAVPDTVKEIEGDRVLRTLDRSRLATAQTPQAFRRTLLEEALAKAERDGFLGTDCASLVERLGVAVAVCPGRPENFKVTHADDLLRAELLLSAEERS